MTTMPSSIPQRPQGLPAPSTKPSHFLFGNARELQADRLGFLMRSLHAYGDVSFLRIFGMCVYTVYHPDGIKQILQDNHANYIKGPLFDPIRALSLIHISEPTRPY